MREQGKCRKHIFISGMVQGVGFRYFTYECAKELRVKGFVRNLPDGRVEVIAEGDKDSVEEMVENLKKGSAFSKVTDVKIVEEDYDGEFEDFTITMADGSVIM
jgi:acylphosphatase